MNITIKLKMQLLCTKLLCSFLFVKSLIFSRKLHVKHFVYTTQLTFRGNVTELNWKVIGCYKITIQNFPVLPGNLSHKKLKLEKKINEIEINFYGIGGQKESRKIVVETSSLELLNSFLPKVNLRNLSSVPLFGKDLKTTFDYSFNHQVLKKINLNKPIILSRKLIVKFEPFIKSNYPIKQ